MLQFETARILCLYFRSVNRKNAAHLPIHYLDSSLITGWATYIMHLSNECTMKQVILAIIALTALSGCTMRYVSSDGDAPRYKDVWEMGHLSQRVIKLNVTAENVDDPYAGAAVVRAFLDTAKFKLARADDKPELIVDVNVRESKTRFARAAILNAFLLYIIPVTSQRCTTEVTVKIREFTGRELDPQYAQSRGKMVIWLGYAFWPAWTQNRARAAVMRRDTIKAAVVKTARSLATEAKP